MTHSNTHSAYIKYEWFLLLILASVQFTNILDYMIMMPLGPQLMREFHVTTQEFSYLVAIYNLSAATCGMISALYIDRFDRRHSLLLFYAGLLIATLLCSQASSYSLLMMARATAGGCGGVIEAVVFSIVGDVIAKERQGRATGIIMMAFSLSSILGVPLGIFIASYSSWRMTFITLCISIALIYILAWKFVPAVREHLNQTETLSPIEQIKAVFKDKQNQKAFIFIFFLMTSSFSVIPFINPYLVTNFGIPERDTAFYYMFGGALTLFTGRLIGKLADLYGKQKVFMIMAICSMFIILTMTNLYEILDKFNYLSHPFYPILGVMGLFMVILSGRFIPAMALINSSINPKNRGSFMSFNVSVDQLSCGIATFVSGIIITHDTQNHMLLNYPVVGIMSVFLSFCAIFMSFQLIKKTTISS